MEDYWGNSFSRFVLCDGMAGKCICQRWGIIDKATGNEIGTLGWYTNSSKEEVIKHANNNGIIFEEWEEVQVVEEH